MSVSIAASLNGPRLSCSFLHEFPPHLLYVTASEAPNDDLQDHYSRTENVPIAFHSLMVKIV